MNQETPAVKSTRRDVVKGGLGAGIALGLGSQLVVLEKLQAQETQPGDRVGDSERTARLERLREALGDNPVVMLNLLKFKEGGQASFGQYGQAFAKPRDKYAPGTTVVFAGQCRELLIGGEEWDLVILVQYPSVSQFAAMAGSPEYAEISHLRTDALERAVLYALSPMQQPA